MNKEALLLNLGKTIKVDRGGPESLVGKLIAVEKDYFALLTEEDGVVYYQSKHIRSITRDAKDFPTQPQEDGEEPGVLYYQGENFVGVIRNFKNSWVKINRGGPESLEGILNEIHDDYVTIISKQEVVIISLFHIRNISFGPKKEEEKSNAKNTGRNPRR